MKTISYFIVLLSILNLNSCSSDQEHPPSSNNSIKKIDYAPYFSNPYDTIGKYHNLALEYVFNKYVKTSHSRTSNKEQLDSLILTFFKEKPFSNNFTITKEELKYHEPSVARSETTMTLLSEKQKKLFNELQNIINKENHTSTQDLISKINQLEKQINSSNLVENEKAILLSTTAVAKYSSSYWIEKITVLETQQTRSQTKIPPEEMYNGDWNTWFYSSFMPNAERVLWADVEGGIQGATQAFLFMGHTGPLAVGMGSAFIGAIIQGAVLGAIGNSVWEGITIIWKIFNE